MLSVAHYLKAVLYVKLSFFFSFTKRTAPLIWAFFDLRRSREEGTRTPHVQKYQYTRRGKLRAGSCKLEVRRRKENKSRRETPFKELSC